MSSDDDDLAHKMPGMTADERRLFMMPMSVSEVAEFLGVSERSLYRALARQKPIPRVGVGKVPLGWACRAYATDEREQAAERRARMATDDPREQRAIAEALYRCWQGLPPPPRAEELQPGLHILPKYPEGA